MGIGRGLPRAYARGRAGDQTARRQRPLLFVEATERCQSRLKALALVSRADEPLGEPGRPEDSLHVGEIRVQAVALSAEVIAYGLVKRETVGHRRGGQRRDL